MERPLLNDADIVPTDDVLDSVLHECGETYRMFRDQLPTHQIALEWRYYNDGKSWLGKAVSKKKTVFWLSVWPGFFKITFYFTEKTRGGIQALSLSDDIKTRIATQEPMGKLIPLILAITEEKCLADAFTLIAYKQNCK